MTSGCHLGGEEDLVAVELMPRLVANNFEVDH